MSIISIGVGSVLLGIILDYSLHIFTHHRSVGKVEKVISDLTWPVLISSFTTAAAFLCLYMVRSDALHDLGLFSAMSVVTGAVFALWLLPLFLKKESKKDQERTTFLDKWAAYPLGKNKYVIWTVAIVSIVCLFNVSEFHFESDLNKVNFMSEKTKAAEAKLNSITSETMRGVYLVAHGHDMKSALQANAQLTPIIDSFQKAESFRDFRVREDCCLRKINKQRK
ncbi:MAG: hypothetical protein R2879_20705 [Saprospiraceae bacterium]